MQKNFFPAYGGTGNVCAGVELNDNATPNGCGCKPNDVTVCAYNENIQGTYDDKCYLCTTADLAFGICPDCVECLKSCDSCMERMQQNDGILSYKNCLKRMDDSCRASCTTSCKKLG